MTETLKELGIFRPPHQEGTAHPDLKGLILNDNDNYNDNDDHDQDDND